MNVSVSQTPIIMEECIQNTQKEWGTVIMCAAFIFVGGSRSRRQLVSTLSPVLKTSAACRDKRLILSFWESGQSIKYRLIYLKSTFTQMVLMVTTSQVFFVFYQLKDFYSPLSAFKLLLTIIFFSFFVVWLGSCDAMSLTISKRVQLKSDDFLQPYSISILPWPESVAAEPTKSWQAHCFFSTTALMTPYIWLWGNLAGQHFSLSWQLNEADIGVLQMSVEALVERLQHLRRWEFRVECLVR